MLDGKEQLNVTVVTPLPYHHQIYWNFCLMCCCSYCVLWNLTFFLKLVRQLKMKNRYKTHPAHNQNHSSSHSENYADDDGIGTKWYSVVSRLFIHQVCPLMYSWSTHTHTLRKQKAWSMMLLVMLLMMMIAFPQF